MKHHRYAACSFALSVCALLAPGCRAMQINNLEKRLDGLETRVAVLESQVAPQPSR